MEKNLRDMHEALIGYALSLPGAFEDHPWGERVAKVGKKVFVFFGRSTPDDPRLMLAVKLPESGLKALDQSFTEPTGYGLGKSGWVSATFASGDRPPAELLRAWVLESYRAIAPKKLLKEYDANFGKTSIASPKSKPVLTQRSSKKPLAKKRPR